ncbi:hypothetical protein GCM10009555_070270 [Acrocarpospora macrocephala]|uniref:Uncharacterized protein n=1 Tax=Acrocarpospora macrocephala TaxID=150177 RepID=A0A5M3X0D5_9ACTN|nr:hypothetical protein [Acrocarpospora macrocephala]GES13061.1 hypothetical protein Amac_066580 [Acrocarpospora macrocephala]
MTTNENGLGAELRELARSPAPPMRVDIARAREVGRRRLWRRRIGGLLSALVVSGTLAVGWTVVSGGPERVTVATVSEGTDPLVAYASFGWLPDTVAGVSYVVGAHGDQVMAGGPGMRLILSMYAPDDEPPVESGHTALSAQPVNGRRAYWITADPADPVNGGDAYLRWQVPDGRWAELHAYDMPEADPRPTMLRIAADVTVGTRPVPLPLHISSVPADFEITEVHFWRPAMQGDGAWELMIFYAADGGRVTLVVSPEGSRTVSPRGSCMAEAGLELCVTVEGKMPESLAAIGGPEALLRRATLLGMDEREWTTRVIG